MINNILTKCKNTFKNLLLIACFFTPIISYANSQIQMLPNLDLGPYGGSGVNRYSMVADKNNRLYIAFPSSGCGGRPEVLYLDYNTATKYTYQVLEAKGNSNNCLIKIEDQNPLKSVRALDVQIAINPITNMPYVAYRDYNDNNKLNVIEYIKESDGYIWQNVINQNVQQLPDGVGHISLAVTKNGNPVVAYQNLQDAAASKNYVSVIRLYKFPGTSAPSNFGYIGPKYITQEWTRGFLHLQLDNNDKMYLAYLDWNFKPWILSYNGYDWLNVGNDDFQFENNRYDDAIDFKVVNNIPYIVGLSNQHYHSDDWWPWEWSYQVSVYKYGSRGTKWQDILTTPVYLENADRQYFNHYTLAITANNTPYIAVYNDTYFGRVFVTNSSEVNLNLCDSKKLHDTPSISMLPVTNNRLYLIDQMEDYSYGLFICNI